MEEAGVQVDLFQVALEQPTDGDRSEGLMAVMDAISQKSKATFYLVR